MCICMGSYVDLATHTIYSVGASVARIELKGLAHQFVCRLLIPFRHLSQPGHLRIARVCVCMCVYVHVCIHVHKYSVYTNVYISAFAYKHANWYVRYKPIISVDLSFCVAPVYQFVSCFFSIL